MKKGRWIVYVLSSTKAGRTYVGATNDLENRLLAHNGKRPGGARSTKAGRPWVVKKIYGPFCGRSGAQKGEARVKKAKGHKRFNLSFDLLELSEHRAAERQPSAPAIWRGRGAS